MNSIESKVMKVPPVIGVCGVLSPFGKRPVTGWRISNTKARAPRHRSHMRPISSSDFSFVSGTHHHTNPTSMTHR